ncbi:MAG: Gmad2 immunoglobulin-like domain-containing protein [Nocardioidaceae bacterium]|nr:Gmad2 immunoglobulin-like domain-containing protein [Nocardioidaceae bacterium]
MNDKLETELRSAIRTQAESVHPADRLGAIRARTQGGSAPARTSWWNRPWVLAAGTGLVAASVITAAVVVLDTSADAPVAGAERDVTVYEVDKVGSNWWLYPEQVTVVDADDPEVDAAVALEALKDNPGDVECELALDSPAVEIGADVVTIYAGSSAGNLDNYCITAKDHIDARLQQLAWTLRSAIGWESQVRVGRGQAVVADPAAISPILIDSPADGATVASPVTVRGTSDTFEANVVWEVRGDGTAKDGTTMGGTMGARAPFEFTVDLEPGTYTARAYAEDMETGGLFAEDTVTFTVE